MYPATLRMSVLTGNLMHGDRIEIEQLFGALSGAGSRLHKCAALSSSVS